MSHEVDQSARPDGAVTLEEAGALVGACAWPSEAFWRILELQAVRRSGTVDRPVLELGCGDGAFTELTGMTVDLAVDRQARAVARSRRRTRTYRDVRQVDVHDLDPALGPFGTVFSNSVLEHVPDLQPVLVRCRELLGPGGKLVTTVPLADMNAHLAFGSSTYADARQRQLQHTNVWSEDRWRDELRRAGFGEVLAHRYLPAPACRRWDRVDIVGALGTGRYRVAPILHRGAQRVLPGRVKAVLKRRIAARLLRWSAQLTGDVTCAAVLIATASECTSST